MVRFARSCVDLFWNRSYQVAVRQPSQVLAKPFAVSRDLEGTWRSGDWRDLEVRRLEVKTALVRLKVNGIKVIQNSNESYRRGWQGASHCSEEPCAPEAKQSLQALHCKSTKTNGSPLAHPSGGSLFFVRRSSMSCFRPMEMKKQHMLDWHPAPRGAPSKNEGLYSHLQK